MGNENFLFEMANYENGKEYFEIWQDNADHKGYGVKILAITDCVHTAIIISKALDSSYENGVQVYQMESENGKRKLVDGVGNY